MHEDATAGLVSLECIRLAPRSIQGEHQLLAEPLAQRMFDDQRLELTDELSVSSACELGLESILERREPHLVQPGDLDPGESIEREIRQRWSPPERERIAEEDTRLGRRRASCSPHERFEAMQVELAIVDP
ncbi:MAG TPA: hypothetical protein VH816_06195 [Gaiellaceae bacterium]|jgi:hypothetical protein